MTGLLEKALRRVEALSEEEQHAIATQILEPWVRVPRLE
jgi:hypothetical protein